MLTRRIRLLHTSGFVDTVLPHNHPFAQHEAVRGPRSGSRRNAPGKMDSQTFHVFTRMNGLRFVVEWSSASNRKVA